MSAKLIFLLIIIIVLLIYCSPFTSKKSENVLYVDDVYKLILENEHNPDFVILDVRSKKEYNNGHLKNAINISYFSTVFMDKISNLDKSKTYIIYCHSGVRSGGAFKKMKNAGFNSIYDFSGGFTAWKKSDKPYIE